ncbi:nucleotidyltransferase [Staphylococcus hyicus]|uniref:nucleotidyltransferase n=1 Tax=Staphylococcus hyicus TaxID=1284 RepID=UPI00208FCE0A|nr:nucleotidyltransferase [Staphylococcus hyicus]MCO4332764.1 nucleotidyltransferase [Staphylococcus hyicus]MCO4334443.1 nucleotidyltransferase [Staphylococcus hyicus]
MKSVAFITEYNPFHNGHLYHVQQSKSISKADVTIAIMSGHFMMRGIPSMFSKFTRTKMALTGVDLVVELPLIGSLSSSDRFAEMGIKVADYLNVDALSFGSEIGDIEILKTMRDKMLLLESTSEFINQIKQGKSYPRIMRELLNHSILDSPNNILGLSYLKQLALQQSRIEPLTIPRQYSDHHQNDIKHLSFASGTAIRQDIINQGTRWKSCVPTENHALFENAFTDTDTLFQLIKFATLQHDTNILATIHTMSEGFEHRLKREISVAHDYDTLMSRLKTKRYTYTHIQRILINVLLHYKYDDVKTSIDAVRILGMTRQGQAFLKSLKQQYPEKQFVTNVNKNNAHYFKNEIKATEIYNLLAHQDETDFNTPVIICNAR